MSGSCSRREFLGMGLKGMGAGLLAPRLPGVFSSTTGQATRRRHNVLFIAVDDLRPQLRCYGHEQMISPNIDRLAGGGTLFERTYCQVPICGASRASLLSGCRPDTTRIHYLKPKLDETMPDVLTLPQHFRNNGYTTVSLGKVYHVGDDDKKGWSQPPWHPKRSWPGYVTEEIEQLRTRLWEEGGKKKQRWEVLGPPVEAADVPDDVYADGTLTNRAIEELGRLRHGPFFLAVGFVKPHLAFACPKRYWDLYRRDEIDLADNPFRPGGAPDAALHNWGELRAYCGIPKEGPLPDDQALELIHGYYACTSFIDAQIGRLLDELERLGLRDNTVIVLWGDHGWNLGEHGLWCKHCNFETSLHSPLIASAPGVPAGQRVNALTEFVDIYPSLCEVCGLSVPDHLEGASFAPLMRQPDRPWKQAVFSQYGKGRSVKTPRYRYTEWKEEEGNVYARMLYDHQADPYENVNVAELPANAELVQRLTGMLAAGWREALPGA